MQAQMMKVSCYNLFTFFFCHNASVIWLVFYFLGSNTSEEPQYKCNLSEISQVFIYIYINFLTFVFE